MPNYVSETRTKERERVVIIRNTSHGCTESSNGRWKSAREDENRRKREDRTLFRSCELLVDPPWTFGKAWVAVRYWMGSLSGDDGNRVDWCSERLGVRWRR
jgi:hypothetical protein